MAGTSTISRFTFLLTPLREGRRPWRRAERRKRAYFYSRPCGRGDLQSDVLLFLGGIFLLTPLREGRPILRRISEIRKRISTHAPAGGATLAAKDCTLFMWISTHAPAGGATRLPHHRRIPETDFYSRPCGRGDLSGFRRRSAGRSRISTHAPAGGATPAPPRLRGLLALFLLTPLREGRQQFSTSPS